MKKLQRPAGRRAAGLLSLLAIVVAVPDAARADDDADFIETSGADVVTGLRFVQFKSAPVAEANLGTGAEKAYRKKLQDEKAAFRAEARARGIAFSERKTYDLLFNGLAVAVAPEDVAALEALESVVATYPVHQFLGGGPAVAAAPPQGVSRDTVTVTTFTRVPEAHAAGIRGAGVTVGVIDGGIDYNHPALGGPGFPNSKVIGGWDFADNDADPFDDSNGNVQNHGTHVSGIVAGSDGHMVGVAPDAKLRFYRVFGTTNYGGSEDIIIAAMERAAAEGCNVVNMSLGSSRSEVYQQGLLARATDNLQKLGVVPVVAVGNAGTAGPFLPSSPAIAKNAIAVAAAYNSSLEELAFRLLDGSKVAYRIMYAGPTTPALGDFPVVDFGTANCAPIPAGVRYDGKVVLVKASTFSCRSYTQVNLLAGAGAAAVIWWQNTSSATGWPSQFGSYQVRFQIPAVIVRRVDVPRIQAQGTGAPIAWGHYTELSYPTYPGMTTFFSSWGPSHELDFKPDVMAPGGFIFSTVPLHSGGYGLADGTSMASPHVAGVAALVLSAHPELIGKRSREVRSRLLSSAVPVAFNLSPGLGLHSAAQQGAGMVDAVAAIGAAAKIEPAKLALHDLRGATRTETITVENKSAVALSYDVSHAPGVAAAPPMTSAWQASAAAATVTMSTARLVVPANGQATLSVSFREPAGVPDGTVLSGWIELTPVAGGRALRVPYVGLKGAYQALPAINPTFTAINTTLDNPALRPELRPNCSGPPPTRAPCCADPRPMSCGWSIGKNVPVMLDYTNSDKYDDAATVMLSQGFPMLRKYRVRVVDDGGRTVAYAFDRYTNRRELKSFEYWVRNSGAGTGTDFAEWYGDLEDGSPAPSGTYYMRMEFDKLQGDGKDAPDFESWTSPVITVIRP